MAIVVFDSGDGPYQRWMALHPKGLVANTERTPGSGEFMLHRSGCHHVAAYGPPRQGDGCFTKLDQIKVCALSWPELRQWFEINRPNASLSARCKTCEPRA